MCFGSKPASAKTPAGSREPVQSQTCSRLVNPARILCASIHTPAWPHWHIFSLHNPSHSCRLTPTGLKLHMCVRKKQPIFTGFWWDWLTGSCEVQSFARMCTKMTDAFTSPHLFAEIYTCWNVWMSVILSSVWIHSPSVLDDLVHHPKAILAPLKIPYLWRETFRREVSLDVKTFWKPFSWYEFFDSKDVIMPICCVIVALLLV